MGPKDKVLESKAREHSVCVTVPEIFIGIQTNNHYVSLQDPSLTLLVEVRTEGFYGINVALLGSEVSAVLGPNSHASLSALAGLVGGEENKVVAFATLYSNPGPTA